MIPEELHLRNFLSHRATDLDLRGIHLAALVGENGAGKSSLLDAITWAVWGRSRTAYGLEENLIYHGESAVEVEFTFRMPYQGGDERRFRILRRREVHGRRSANSLLDFQVQSEQNWRTLNADSIRDTQARIIQQLGLDYDTFINSAYLRQGHADEFTVQTPANRKRVLSLILGLERWADYSEQVKKRLAEVQGQAKELERRLTDTEAELARRPEHEAALAQAEAAAQEVAARLQAVQQEAEALARLQEQAAALQRQLADLERRLKQEEERQNALQGEMSSHQRRLADYQERIAQAEAIEGRYRTYQATLAEERAWGERLSQAARLQTAKAEAERAIAQAAEALARQAQTIEREESRFERLIADQRARLDKALGDLRGQLRAQEERLASATLAAELAEAQARLAALERLAEELEQTRTIVHEAEVENSRLTERNRQLKARMNETKANLDTLAEAGAVCPLCRQPLTEEHRVRLLAELQAEGTAMGDEFRANLARSQVLAEQKTTLQGQLREWERALQERPRREQAVARLHQQVEQGEAARQRAEQLRAQAGELQAQLDHEAYAAAERETLARLRAERAALQARLEENDYAAEERAALAAVLADLSALGYDAAAHEQVKAQMRALAPAEEEYRELEKARVGIQGEEEALKRLAQELATQTARRAEIETAHAAQTAALEALRPQLAQAPRINQALNEARQAEANARQRVGAARQNLAALQTLETRLGELRRSRDSLNRRSAILTELRDAFGVNGVPAMIIDHTLPALEREANRILEQLTGGRMHIRFETQRQTKTGGLHETLDIIISDEKGTRPYENFSGGEQFRANFAIRVALSRLLAQRSGVRLRSLFVDEGFGALDAEGRRRLVEAVKAVQDEFDLILVITHIEEMQDAFPSRIQVTKTEAGSQVELL